MPHLLTHLLLHLRPELLHRRKLVNPLLAVCMVCTVAHAQNAPQRSLPSNASSTSSFTNSAITAELFYQLLMAELNVTPGLGGSPGAGFSLVLDAARKTNDASLFKRAVEIAIQNRSGDAATQAARAWKQAQPTSSDANLQLLQVLLATGKANETTELLKTQITLTPVAQRKALIEQLPRLYSRVADRKAAVTIFEQGLAEHLAGGALASAAWISVGRMRLAAGDAPGSLEATSRAQQAEPLSIAAAFLALEMMEPKQPAAEALVRNYLQTAKPISDVRMGYARALMDAQRYSEALVQVQLLTREQPNFAESWLVLGGLELQDNKVDNADIALKRYLTLMDEEPTSDAKQRGLTQAYLSLAQVAEKRKDFSLAESWLAKVDSPQALVSTQNRRASMLAKQGKINEARELIRKIPERSGEDGIADQRSKMLSEVALLREHKQYQAAYELLGSAVERDPKDHELLYEQASTAEKLSKWSEFERLLRQLIATKPDYHHAYNALGYSLADRNVRLPEAKALIKKALEFAPGDPFITDSLAWVEYRMGNRAEALRLLELAYKTRADAEIAAHLGELYWVSGQREKAISMWKEGMLLNADNDTLLETLKRFKVKL